MKNEKLVFDGNKKIPTNSPTKEKTLNLEVREINDPTANTDPSYTVTLKLNAYHDNQLKGACAATGQKRASYVRSALAAKLKEDGFF